MSIDKSLAWFTEPRYSVTDLQRAHKQARQQALAEIRAGVDLDRMRKRVAENDRRDVIGSDDHRHIPFHDCYTCVARDRAELLAAIDRLISDDREPDAT